MVRKGIFLDFDIIGRDVSDKVAVDNETLHDLRPGQNPGLDDQVVGGIPGKGRPPPTLG